MAAAGGQANNEMESDFLDYEVIVRHSGQER